MLILKLGQIVDVLVDNDVEIIRLVMRRYVTLREGFRHNGGDATLIIETEERSKSLGGTESKMLEGFESLNMRMWCLEVM
jgi:hypothetical protein